MKRFKDFADLAFLTKRKYNPIMIEILNTFLLGYRHDINLTELKFIGSGCYAHAFKYRDKVFKVTSNAEDFILAHRLMLNPMTAFVKVYNAITVLFNDKKYYILETEYAGVPVGNTYSGYRHKVFDYLVAYFGEQYYTLALKRNYCYERFLSERYENLTDEKWNEEEKKFIFEAYKAYEILFNQVLILKPKAFDYHTLNISFHNGIVKAFDFGSSDNTNLTKNVKILQLN